MTSFMKDLIRELIPHAPQMGLYVAPNIPAKKLNNALRDYAKQIHEKEVLALYDATRLGSAKDGAVFAANRFIFENNNLEGPQIIRYEDIVEIGAKRKLLGGRKIHLSVNRSRATFDLAIDFAVHPEAAEYVERFLSEAMLRPSMQEQVSGSTNITVVRQTLDKLRQRGDLSDSDYHRILDILT